jgi:hypothetical protein
MTRIIALTFIVVVILTCALSIPAAAQSPVGGALATLAAATEQAQMIRQAQEATYAAQRATIQAVMVEQTRTAAQVQATATAVSVLSTQSALDELQRQRSMTATAEHGAIVATSTALAQSAQATAQAEKLNGQATRETYQTQATAQAVLWSQQATAVARQNETAATRQERFTFGLLIIEIGFIAGALLIIVWLTRTLVLWARRLAPQPVNDAPILADSEAESIGPPPTGDELPIPPLTRVVYDEAAARRIGEILEMQ